MGPEVYCHVQKSPLLDHVLSQMNPLRPFTLISVRSGWTVRWQTARREPGLLFYGAELSNVYTSSPYLKENTALLHYKDHTVNADCCKKNTKNLIPL
jgi:hypothetical protein